MKTKAKKTRQGSKARSAKAEAAKPRRSRGRPRATQGKVGRDAIIAAARQLLEKLPPHKATISSIARGAGVDPALVRYYFSSRDELMLAVIEDILATWDATHPPANATPSTHLAAHLHNMVDFARQVRAMQRLMVEECAGSRVPEVRRRVRELNARVVSNYALLLHLEKDGPKNSTDALFMHVAVIGMSEFFAAAQPMIAPLAPEGLDADELAERYKDFIARLVLDGLRARVEPWSARVPGTA